MTELLERAITAIKMLPSEVQDAIASRLKWTPKSRQFLAKFKVDTLRLIVTGLVCRHTPQRVFGCSAPDEDAGYCKT